MSRYSWATTGDGGAFVVCHASTAEMGEVAPCGLVCPALTEVTKWELISALEDQDSLNDLILDTEPCAQLR